MSAYEYTVEIIYDKDSGHPNIAEIQHTLKTMAANGWRLVSVTTNEIGKTSSSTSFGGYSAGTNSTVDSILLFFERKIDSSPKCFPDYPQKFTNKCYNTDSLLRILSSKIHYSDENILLIVSGIVYKHQTIKNALVDIILISDYSNESIYESVVLIADTQRGDLIQFLPVKLRENDIVAVNEIKIIIKAYNTGTETIQINQNNNQENINSSITKDNAVVRQKEVLEDYWICTCGKVNSIDEPVCLLCGKKRGMIIKESDTLFDIIKNHFAELEELQSTSEIYETLLQLNITDPYFQNEVLPEIEKKKQIERMYGNTKKETIEYLKKTFDQKL